MPHAPPPRAARSPNADNCAIDITPSVSSLPRVDGPPSETWSFPAVAHEVVDLRHALTQYVTGQRVCEPTIIDMKLAVSEAVTNSVLHGYPSGEPGTVTVVATVDAVAALLTVVVTDDGSGVRPRPDSPGLGLGFPLITTLTKTANITAGPDGHGTRVSMTFGLERPRPLHLG